VSFPAPLPPITRLGARQQAEHELSKAVYHRNSEPWTLRLVRYLARQLDHLLFRFASHSPGGSLGALLIVVLVGLVVGLVLWKVGMPTRAREVAPLQPAGDLRSAREHRARADRAATLGDWNTSFIERVRAIASELVERGIIDERPGRTATELATEAGRLLPDLAPDLRTVAARFNQVAYGGHTAGEPDARLATGLDEALQRSARRQVPVG
jgi:hypothetical protein